MTVSPREFITRIDPLTASCEILGIDPPHIHLVGEDDLPSIYRVLLAHDRDMTSTLERYWGAKLHLRVIEKHLEDHRLTRQVVLVTDTDDRPVEFGAIRIFLDRFGDAPRQEIESCTRPLGTILEHHRIKYTCSPSAFFACPSSEFIERVFGIVDAGDLYGRCNTILNGTDEPLAEVVEILAPLDSQQ